VRRFDVWRPRACLSVEQGGARNAPHGLALVSMARDPAPADLNAVRIGIGAELRRLHSDVLRAEIPDRMAELASLPRAARPQTPMAALGTLSTLAAPSAR